MATGVTGAVGTAGDPPGRPAAPPPPLTEPFGTPGAAACTGGRLAAGIGSPGTAWVAVTRSVLPVVAIHPLGQRLVAGDRRFDAEAGDLHGVGDGHVGERVTGGVRHGPGHV